MSLILFGPSGLQILPTSPVADLEFDPVLGGYLENDGSLFFEAIPDVWRLLSDTDMLKAIWEGFMQIGSDLLQQAVSARYAASLLDVPLDWIRKFQQFDLEVEQTLVSSPEFESDRGSSWEWAQDGLTVSWENAVLPARSGWALESAFDDRAFTRWSWTATYSQMDNDAYGFVGLFNRSESDVHNALLVGVGNGGRVAILQGSSTTSDMVETAEAVLALDEEVRIDVEYDGQRSVVRVNVTRVSDDTALLEDWEYALTSGSGVEHFEVDTFGIMGCPMNLRPAHSEFRPRAGRVVDGLITALTYLDPSLPAEVQHIPCLQDRWSEPIERMVQDEDYNILDTASLGGRFIAFRSPFASLAFDPSFVLAEYVSWNRNLVRDNFGHDIGIDGPNTKEYKAQVQALYYAYLKGPTRGAIKLGVQVLLGLPFASEAGTVTAINPVYSSTHGQIVIDSARTRTTRTYLYPVEVAPAVEVGDDVEVYQALTDGVRIQDYRSDPLWFNPYLLDQHPPGPVDPFEEALRTPATESRGRINLPSWELQKYHVYQVEIGSHLFNFQVLVPINSFLRSMTQTWKDVIVTVKHVLDDELVSDDDQSYDMTWTIADHGGSSTVLDPQYGDPGYAPYDYQYGTPGLIYGMFRRLFPTESVGVRLDNVSGSPQTITLLGTPVTVPDGDYVEDTWE